MNRPVLAYALVLAGAILWNGLIVAAPVLAAGGAGWAGGLYAFFQPVCHQLDGRSLHIAGEPLAVCARCAAIYAGFLSGVMVYPLLRPVRAPRPPSRKMLAIALAPMALDVILGLAGLHEVSLATRLVTGGVFGLLIPFVVLPVFIGAVTEMHTLPSTIHNQSKGRSNA